MKYYLMYHDIKVLDHHIDDEWYLLEKGVDYVGRYKPKAQNHYVLYEANSIPELLHQMQNKKDWRFYIVTGSLSSKGRKREEEYPLHRHICPIAGFIPEVCDIRLQPGEHYFGEKWVIDYVRELFICPGGLSGDKIIKVKGFTEKIERAVEEYRINNKLEFGITVKDST